MNQKKYKAAIFDMDGTLVLSDPTAIPSPAVMKAITAAHDHAFIAAATGRAPVHAVPVMHALNITNASVLYGGSQIYNPATDTVEWEVLLSTHQLTAIAAVFEKYKTEESKSWAGEATYDELSDYVKTAEPIHGLSLILLDQKNINDAANEINAIPGVSGHVMPSWLSGYNIDICHEKGDKEHGLLQLMKMHELKQEDVLVCGDSSNDLPLFAAGGFRVAMGNAIDEIKSLADYIAPSVEEDGVAHVIEKFILPN